MKFKKILPYFLFGTLAVLPKSDVVFDTKSNTISTEQTTKIPSAADIAQQKAKALCNEYIQRVLDGQKNIKKSKQNMSYASAVRQELPGAPVGLHCLFGQRTQLNRSLRELGDTLSNFTPNTAGCPTFRDKIIKQYPRGIWHYGKMYKSDNEYNSAFYAYLRQHNITENSTDAEIEKLRTRFEKNNYSIESLHPGTIIIVQRSPNPNNTHAIMYLGRGRVVNGKFIESQNGTPMYAGYNNETIAEINFNGLMFGEYPVFAFDVNDAVMGIYEKQAQEILDMSNMELIQYVYSDDNYYYAAAISHETAISDAIRKFTNPSNEFVPTVRAPMNAASVVPFALKKRDK
jgi:hypothetical protein